MIKSSGGCLVRRTASSGDQGIEKTVEYIKHAGDFVIFAIQKKKKKTH